MKYFPENELIVHSNTWWTFLKWMVETTWFRSLSLKRLDSKSGCKFGKREALRVEINNIVLYRCTTYMQMVTRKVRVRVTNSYATNDGQLRLNV